MNLAESIVLCCNILFCIPSLASLTRFDYWWIRGFDFPRVQISILISANIIAALIVYPFDNIWNYVMASLLVLSLIYQLVKIFPYTPLGKLQVIGYDGGPNEDNISILVSNVLMKNEAHEKLIDLVLSKEPDVFLTLESDKRWERALEPLEESYGYCVKVPLDNRYGMHLYSKYPLENTKVKYLVEEDIPSIHSKLILQNGQKVSLHCLHPKPPSPSESKTSTNRDAELLLVGKEIDNDADLVLVCGDLNDVAWSRTTKMFQKLSGLLDPRRGRGFFNTFHADYRLLRWPLDHIFHSEDFTLMEINREKNIGSDHFPMYTKLNYTPKAEWQQESPDASKEEEKWAREKIDKADTADSDIDVK
ncbi:MAG: endonuclease/exonuclease/phosphatase family protein [Pricia sp.]